MNLKHLLVAVAAAFSLSAFAATDVNKATAAELEAVKGVGPGIAGKIVEERKKGDFKDWNDLVDRVKGVGTGNAAKFSTAGMTVGGAAYAGAPAKKEAKPAAAKKEDKPMAEKKEAKEAKPMAADKPADKPAAMADKKSDKPAAAAAAASAAKK